MAPISTAPNEIDRKLHRILLDSNPKKFTTMMALGRSIAVKKYVEFSYLRGDETEFATPSTIQNYVGYARDIGLLDGNLASSRKKEDIRALENFQQWLSDTVSRFLSNTHCSIEHIRETGQRLLRATPCELPTQENVHADLENPPPLHTFRASLKILSLLRPGAIQVRSRRIVLIPGLVKD